MHLLLTSIHKLKILRISYVHKIFLFPPTKHEEKKYLSSHLILISYVNSF